MIAPGTKSDQITTLSDSKSIVASSTLDPSKKRRRFNYFHAGNWHHYMYDEFPGPGEPMQPCPPLAFLHGLTWICDEKNWRDSDEDSPIITEVRRRSDMPSWSWVSLRKGPFSYRTDYASAKEISGDVQLNLHNGIQVWVQQKSDLSQIEWIAIDDAWRQCSGKVLPDFGRQIKLETLASDVASCTVTIPEFNRNKYEYTITLRSLTAADGRKLMLDPDCAPEDLPVSGPGIYQDLGWKIALIFSTSFYNPDHEDAWDDIEPQRDYLVLRPADSIWKRVGIMTTNIHFNDRDRGVESVLRRETLILC